MRNVATYRPSADQTLKSFLSFLLKASSPVLILSFQVKSNGTPLTVCQALLRAIFSSQQRINTKYAVVCGGLFADRLAAKSGCEPAPKIVPFRGDYMILKPEKAHLARGNIYPASKNNSCVKAIIIVISEKYYLPC